MTMLASDPRTIFIGQACRYKGTSMSGTLVGVPRDKLIEFPVAEETQMGVSIGLALTGFVPISLYTRFNFLLLAANQLVNHLDKMKAHVIVRVGIGSTHPMHPGPQHVGNMTEAFKQLCPGIEIVRIDKPLDAVPAYSMALNRQAPSLIVEHGDFYNA